MRLSPLNRRLALTIAAAGLASSTALAQTQLELRIVPQDGVLPGAITDQADTQHADLLNVGDVRRFEVQYRIVDTNTTDLIVPAGLASMQFDICATGGPVTLRRGLLSRFEMQLAGAGAPVSPDASGHSTGTSTGGRGVHRPYRGGIPAPSPNNGVPANGIENGLCINLVTPLSLAQTDQGNVNAGQNNSNWYGLYTFELEVGAGACGRIDLAATPVGAYGYWDHGSPIPLTGSAAVSTPAFVNATGAFPSCVLPQCPQTGTGTNPLVTTFNITGTVTGLDWYWRLLCDQTGPLFADMPAAGQWTQGVCPTCSLNDIAIAFAQSINTYYAACTTQEISATAVGATLSVTTGGGSKGRLWVGPGVNPACDVDPGPCSFQPQITRLALPGRDCNGNSIDDTLDILSGQSRDLDNDQTPDECQAACPLKFTSRPRQRLVPTTGGAQFTATAAGNGTISYQWRKNGVILTNGPTADGSVVAGAVGTGASSTLSISNVRLTDGGQYDCVITNPCASVTMGPMSLMVDCPADFNHSGAISVQDIFDFLAKMFANSPAADVDRSGIVDVNDLFTYLALYFTRCP